MKLKPEELSEISTILQMMVQDAENTKGSLPDRWAQLESLYNLEEYERSFMPHEGAAQFGLPLMTSRIDAVRASIVQPMLMATPYFTAQVSGDGAQHTDVVEQSVSWALDMAIWPERLNQGVQMALLTGMAIFRTWFDARAKGFSADPPDIQMSDAEDVAPDGSEQEIEYAAVRMDNIHPKDFVCYPPTASKVTQARMVGHRDYMRRSDVEAFQRAGIWLEDAAVGITSDVQVAGKSQEYAKTDLNIVSNPEDQPVQIYFLTVKLDIDDSGNESWYEVVYAYETRSILAITPYKWSRPGYFVASVLPTEYRTMFPALSPAKKLEPLALIFNEIANMHIDGVEMSSSPPTFYDPGSGGLADQAAKYAPGDLIPTVGAPQVASVGGVYRGEQVVELLQLIQNMADTALHVPVTAIGGQYQPGTTATAANQAAASQASTQNDMLQTFAGSELCAMVGLIQEYLEENSDVLLQVYGDSCPWSENPEVLGIKCLWSVTGRSPSSIGPTLIQNLQSVVQIAQGLKMDYMVDKKALMQSIVSAMDLPAGARIMHSEDEIAQIEQQMQMQAEEQAQMQAEEAAMQDDQRQLDQAEQISRMQGGMIG